MVEWAARPAAAGPTLRGPVWVDLGGLEPAPYTLSTIRPFRGTVTDGTCTVIRPVSGGFFGKTGRVTRIVPVPPQSRLPSMPRSDRRFVAKTLRVDRGTTPAPDRSSLRLVGHRRLATPGLSRGQTGLSVRMVQSLLLFATLLVAPASAGESIYRRSAGQPTAAAAPPASAPADGAAAAESTHPPAAVLSTSPSPRIEGGSGEEAEGRAERIVSAALAGIARAPSISLRVRQLVRVGDTVLKGGGRYVQSGVDEDQRFRFETRLSAETEEFDVLEVCDGLFFWNTRRYGTLPTGVERIDVRRLRERLGTLGLLARGDTAAYLGGILKPLAQTREWFRFTTVTTVDVEGVPAWVIAGEWDKERLAAILPEQAEALRSATGLAPGDLPDGLPWSVRLSISRRELFPFRLEWLAVPGRRPTTAATEVVGVLEFYDVRIGDPVDAAAFVHLPGNDPLVDLTDITVAYLKPLRP